MSLEDKLIAALDKKENKYREMEFLGNKLLCVLVLEKDLKHDFANIENAEEAQKNSALLEFLSKVFIDPETLKPAFSAKFLQECLPLIYFKELFGKFSKCNGLETNNLKDAEKN